MVASKEYVDFISTKEKLHSPSGFDVEVNDGCLFDYQKVIVKWAVKKGKAAIFASTGLGKTRMFIKWGDYILQNIGYDKKMLILSPLAVTRQTANEAEKCGLSINVCRTQSDVISGMNITNYDMYLNGHFDLSQFDGIILDESSILKSYTGKTTMALIDECQQIPYRLSCTATPSPNDYTELGNQSALLGIMSRSEMLSMYFVHDGGETSKWLLKGHSVDAFWKWVSSWAFVLRKPSDLGFDDKRYELPPLNEITYTIKPNDDEHDDFWGDTIVEAEASTLSERRAAKREYQSLRVDKCVELAKQAGRCVVWCETNSESKELSEKMKDAGLDFAEVKGSDSVEHKEKSITAFCAGELPYIVSKPSIFGFGINAQIANETVFCGLSDSYERYYQAIRRFWRFGQTRAVTVHIVQTEAENSILKNIKRKQELADKMAIAMYELSAEYLKAEIENTTANKTVYEPVVEMEI